MRWIPLWYLASVKTWTGPSTPFDVSTLSNLDPFIVPLFDELAKLLSFTPLPTYCAPKVVTNAHYLTGQFSALALRLEN